MIGTCQERKGHGEPVAACEHLTDLSLKIGSASKVRFGSLANIGGTSLPNPAYIGGLNCEDIAAWAASAARRASRSCSRLLSANAAAAWNAACASP